MKKKIIAISAAIAILAIAVVGGSLAWFTSSAEVTNTFTVGNVSISLDEANVNKDGKKIPTGSQAWGGAMRTATTSSPARCWTRTPPSGSTRSESCLVYVYIDNQLGGHATPDIDTVNWLAVSGNNGLYKYKDTVPAVPAAPKKHPSRGVQNGDHRWRAAGQRHAGNPYEQADRRQSLRIQSANIGELNTAQMAWAAMTPP